LYAGLGDDSKAEPFYGRILASRRPLSIGVPLAEAQRGMARLELRRNRLQEAEVLYRQAIDVVDRNGEWRREAGLLDELAAASAKDGKPQEAAEASARAKSLRMREPPAAPRP
jgi:tetratricopeptide (TPR) repeat protein